METRIDFIYKQPDYISLLAAQLSQWVCMNRFRDTHVTSKAAAPFSVAAVVLVKILASFQTTAHAEKGAGSQ